MFSIDFFIRSKTDAGKTVKDIPYSYVITW